MFDMGEHAVYVWPAYIIVLLVLGFNLLVPLVNHKRLIGKLIKRRHRNDEP